ncbi:MAG: PTS sugar transporter subunit IIC [Brevinema sp.]
MNPGFFEKIEQPLLNLAAKIEGNKYISAIRRAFVMMMPYIMIGSLFLMIEAFPLPAYQNFMKSTFGDNWGSIISLPLKATFDIMAVFIAFLVGQQLAKQFNLDDISVGLWSLVAFLMLTPYGQIPDIGTAIPLTWLGSRGMFVAMIVGLYTAGIYKIFIDKKIYIQMPDGVPPEVIRAFQSLVPGLVITTGAFIVRLVIEQTPYATLHNLIYTVLALPLVVLGTSFMGAILTVIAISVLWSVGINSGSMVNGFVRPFWLENQAQNLEALRAGEPLPHIITEQFFDIVWMGGAGATLSLLLAIFLFARSKHVRGIGTLSLVPGLFNINEPILFGLPIILNPVMLIPFNIVPIVFVITQYIAMSIGLVARPIGVIFPWPTPALISGFLTVGGISGTLMQLFNLILGALIYLPFLKIIDKASQMNEQKEIHS